jgi:phospholipid/cholesterol/gamma-HCH transport system substrate-binding protein
MKPLTTTWIRASVAVVAALSVAVCSSCASPLAKASDTYCAVLPDAIGLYVGNPITQMGYGIGTVTAITPHDSDVHVEFTVDGQRPLPADVKAVVRSRSILADRALELVGNYASGPKLSPGECIPLSRSATPKSLSQVIGSATNFMNTMTPADSTNVGDTIKGLDAALHGNGKNINQLITASGAVLDSPDQAMSDIFSIVKNLNTLTTTVKDIRGPLKDALLGAQLTTGDVENASDGGHRIFHDMDNLIDMVADLEKEMGEDIQLTLDATSTAIRKGTQHANWIANLMNPVPWWINSFANRANGQGVFLKWRPPLYRIRTPDGLLQCGFMNSQVPGSCADIAGMPYAVDVSLLQYVLMEANR